MTTTPQDYEFHPYANIFPLMKGKEFDAFKEDIKSTRKLLYPIALFEGKILDGRNRYNACKDLRIVKPDFMDLPATTDPAAYVISANEKRRHLSQAQRALVAAKLANCKVGDNQHSGSKGLSIEEASKLLKVSDASVSRCRKVLTDGVPELVQMVEQDQIAASVAEEVAKLSKAEQTELVQKGASKVREAVKATNPAAEYDNAEKSLLKKLTALPLEEADDHSQKTIKELKETVSTMKAGAKKAA